MVSFRSLATLTLATLGAAAPLVDYSAAAHDDPTKIGLLDLEAARGVAVKSNTADLFVKNGQDTSGTPALHYHRKEGDIRAEYHALDHKTEANRTYYVGYKFSLGEAEKSLMIWQFKEYEANAHGGANIPLAMEVVTSNGETRLQFQYQASGKVGRVAQWSTPVQKGETYSAGIVVNTGKPEGWVQLYWGGKMQTFDTNGKTTLPANTYPGRAEPKFGAYRGEQVVIDTYVYDIQIGTELADIKRAAGIE